MPIRRIFLGLDQPALPAAADHLIGRYRTDSAINLRDVIVVVPGRRAGRRLLEILVEKSEHARLLLTPPLIKTVGTLPEQLYTPQRPFANDLAQDLAWTLALRTTPNQNLLPPHMFLIILINSLTSNEAPPINKPWVLEISIYSLTLLEFTLPP